jgi:hypothetical protein
MWHVKLRICSIAFLFYLGDLAHTPYMAFDAGEAG